MKILTCKLVIAVSIASLMLSGCGDPGSQPETAASVSSGTVAKVVARTAGAQITLNNVVFATTGAAVTVNGNPAALGDLKQGMQAAIHGDINGSTGSATAIEVEGELAGIVEQVDAAAGRMTLLGRTVAVNEHTVFDGFTGLDSITAGQTAEVYGLADAEGVVVATRVELKYQAGAEYLSGAISNINPVTNIFSIGDITIDYSNATLPAHPLGNNLTVKVLGSYRDGIFAAESIRVRHHHPKSGHSEIAGLVATFDTSTNIFTLNDQKVQFTASTKFLHGTAADIRSGTNLEVKGEIVEGVLVAIRIEIDHEHGSPAVTPPTPPAAQASPNQPGWGLYEVYCAGCHSLGSYDSTGFAPDLSGKGGLLASKLAVGTTASALIHSNSPALPLS